jgi:hypothetical protein
LEEADEFGSDSEWVPIPNVMVGVWDRCGLFILPHRCCVPCSFSAADLTQIVDLVWFLNMVADSLDSVYSG